MDKTTTTRNWTAVRRGAIYCAPACGGRCTFAAFQKATKQAAALSKRLGPGWKPRVWENLGWHYSVDYREGHLSVSPCHWRGQIITYHAYLSVNPPPGGQWVGEGKVAKAAIRDVLGKAFGSLRNLKTFVATLEDVAHDFGIRPDAA